MLMAYYIEMTLKFLTAIMSDCDEAYILLIFTTNNLQELRISGTGCPCWVQRLIYALYKFVIGVPYVMLYWTML